VEERPIYSAGGRFPPNAYMEGDQVPLQLLLLEMYLDWNLFKFDRTLGSADPRCASPNLIFL
jgi:hypothetical protein